MKFTMVRPTHRCNVCGAYWKLWEKEQTWTLTSTMCGKCCDQTSMVSVIKLEGE